MHRNPVPPTGVTRAVTDQILTTSPPTPSEPIKKFVESIHFQRFIIGAILVNAATLGLETSAAVREVIGPFLAGLDRVVVGIFFAEILLKLAVYRWRFFRDGWNVFDFVIVAISLVPASGPFTVLRALRVLRVLRMVSVVPSLRKVVESMIRALPGLGAIIGVLGLLYYVAAVMATNLFGGTHPQWFGTLGASMYTLFQIMTLESWSMGIVRPVMEAHPYAWLFFVPFIIITAFAVLNLFIGVIVNAMNEVEAAGNQAREQEAEARRQLHRDVLLDELLAVRQELVELRRAVGQPRSEE